MKSYKHFLLAIGMAVAPLLLSAANENKYVGVYQLDKQKFREMLLSEAERFGADKEEVESELFRLKSIEIVLKADKTFERKVDARVSPAALFVLTTKYEGTYKLIGDTIELSVTHVDGKAVSSEDMVRVTGKIEDDVLFMTQGNFPVATPFKRTANKE